MTEHYPYYRVWGYKIFDYDEAVKLARQLSLTHDLDKEVEIWKKLDAFTPIYRIATITV